MSQVQEPKNSFKANSSQTTGKEDEVTRSPDLPLPGGKIDK